MKKVSLLIVLGICTHLASAQLRFNFGFGNHLFQDQGHSPFVYAGSALKVGAAYHFVNEKRDFSLSVNRTQTTLRPRLSIDDNFELNLANRSLIIGNITWKRKLNNEDFNAWLGCKLLTHYDFVPFNHNANNLVSYELTNAIAPVVELRLEMSKHWQFQLIASFPLIVASIRPNALGLFPLNNFDISASAILQNTSLHTINQIFYLDNTIAFKYENEKRQATFGLHYFGGYNAKAERKGHVFHSLFVEVPLSFKK